MPNATAPQFRSGRVAKAVCVIPEGDGWVVEAGGVPRASEPYPTQAAALEAARELVRARGGATRVHVAEGRFEESFTLGRQAFEKISAVEGIRLSRTMKRDLLDARANAPSADEARSVLAAKYGRRRP